MSTVVRWTLATLACVGCTAVGVAVGILRYVARAPSDAADALLGGLFVLPAYGVIGGIFGALAGGIAAVLLLNGIPAGTKVDDDTTSADTTGDDTPT